jgi:bacterioferritin-associated ferredoxin|tara:strand:- start:6170 stop:6505 length:336 start_codon:yes stop_codon:yes gene_type:complete
MKKILAISVATLMGLGSFAFAAKKAPEPANDKCPVSGKAINAEKTISVGVCCGNCAKKFAKDVKGNLAKVELDNKDGDTVNKACPFSGKGIKKTVTVGFCCGNCQGKYKAK